VELGRMQVTPVQYSPRLMGEKMWQSEIFLSGINGSKRIACRNHIWRQCYHFLWYLFNTFHKDKKSSKLIIWNLWGGYM